MLTFKKRLNRLFIFTFFLLFATQSLATVQQKLFAQVELFDKCEVFKNSICSTDIRRSDNLLVTSSSTGNVELWYFDQGRQSQLPHPEGVPTVTFSHDGKLVATGSYDNKVRVWRVATAELLNTFIGHEKMVTNVVFSPDDQYLASTSADDSVRLWHLHSKQNKTLKKHIGDVWGLAFSPDGSKLFTGGEDHNIEVWHTETGENLTTLSAHNGAVLSLAFSHDGNWLASGGDDYTVKLWNANTLEVINTFEDDAYSIYDLEFSPDDTMLASGGRDQGLFGEILQYHFNYKGSGDDVSVRIWSPNSGEVIQHLTGHFDDLDTVHFSATGEQLVTSGVDGRVILWQVK